KMDPSRRRQESSGEYGGAKHVTPVQLLPLRVFTHESHIQLPGRRRTARPTEQYGYCPCSRPLGSKAVTWHQHWQSKMVHGDAVMIHMI
ncbi:mCG144944, partial [Mus musculus]